MSTLSALLPQVLPFFAAVAGAVGGSKFVQEGERGVKLRFGKVVRDRRGNPRVVRPGFCFVVPSIEHLRRTHVRTRTYNLPTQDVMLRDNTVFRVSAVVMCHLQDTPDAVYRSLFEIQNLGQSVQDYVASALRDVLAGLNYEQINDQTDVLNQVTIAIMPQMEAWGVVLNRITLTDCSPTEETAKMLLMTTQAAFRADALASVAAKLSSDAAVAGLHPTVAAALIGTPVSVALGGGHAGLEFDDEAN